MTVLNVTDSSFESVLPERGLVIVDFWAPWCGPCRSFAPAFESSAERNPDVAHWKVDVDENPVLSATFKIQAVPTTVVLSDRAVIGQFPGAMGERQLADLVLQARAFRADTRPIEIDASEFELLETQGALLLDVREPFEQAEWGHPVAAQIPIGELPARLQELPRDRTVVCVCRSGQRSLRAAEMLAQEGFQAVSLRGGFRVLG